ncbi:hypothetical protein FRC97_00165 (plasmid) [Paracidovorax citrulli]|uniref:hypothetical protein n=1 Tax=Paracidovorax citrulli TaxID=80869 RepID=UPI00066477E0|nr:hypothetical protein [Paracidovorax citrulli]QCX13173.1 hypothetical protein APS58_p00029 [Paracidovorax citrulli]UMT93552.1 hypothetical protein FRC97_00165 [Paracidovorax citrulli]
MSILTFGGQQYSIAHLAPCQRRVLVPLRGGKEKKVLVEFHFSNHCYSRGQKEGEIIPPDMLVQDGAWERIFDLRRYRLSFVVMESIDALLEEGGDVRWSRHNNFFQVDLVQEGAADPVNFFIFMRARKEELKNAEKRIRVQVESAYPELPNVPSPDFVRTEGILEVLGRVWSNMT